MKKIIPIITMTVFLISCGKKSEEKQIKENKPKEKISKIIKITEKEKPQPKKPPEVIAERVTIGDALSNALNFAKKVDLNTSAEEGNVEYMTIADAKRILDNSKELKMSFVENIANKCKDFDVVNYFMTNLVEKILKGKITVNLKFDVTGLPPQLLKPEILEIARENIDFINQNKSSSAANILQLLAIQSQGNKKYEYSVDVLKHAISLEKNTFLKARHYDILAIAYNSLHDFDKEAESQYQCYKIFYDKKSEYPKEYLTPNFVQYIQSLENAERYNEAIELAEKLINEGYLKDKEDINLSVIKSKNGQKSYRGL